MGMVAQAKREKMDASKFVVKVIGPGLNVHSSKITRDISFHIAVSAQFSTKELPVATMKRKLMIEIDGLDDHQCEMLAKDQVLVSAQPRKVDNCLSFVISNKDLEKVYHRVCELVVTEAR